MPLACCLRTRAGRGRRVVGLGMPGVPPRRAAALR